MTQIKKSTPRNLAQTVNAVTGQTTTAWDRRTFNSSERCDYWVITTLDTNEQLPYKPPALAVTVLTHAIKKGELHDYFFS